MPRNRLIPVLATLGIAAALVAAYASSQLRPPSFHGTFLPAAAPAEFTLEAADRGPVRLADYRGHAVLLFFGYTSCPDACPTTLAKLRRVMEILGERRSDVRVLLVTVDPEVDDPQRLREYVQNFDLGFTGLTGDRETLAQVAASFGIYAGAPDEAAGGSGSAGPEAPHAGHGHDDGAPDAPGATAAEARVIPHTTHVLGLDREGRLRVLWGPDLTAEQIAADVRRLLRL